MKGIERKELALEDEREELRRQLQEANDTLDAIRRGEVDALVVNTRAANEVHTPDSAEDPYSIFIEEMHQGAVTLSAEGLIVFCNRRFAEMVQVNHEKIIGRAFESFIPAEGRAHWCTLLAQADGARTTGEVLLAREDGSSAPAALAINPLGGKTHCLVLSDLTDQKHYLRLLATERDLRLSVSESQDRQRELQTLNRTLRALSSSNQALLRSQTAAEADYLAEICRVITEDCGHAMVWIGLAETDPGRSVQLVAHAGFDLGYLERLRLTWADTERGQGPTGMAIRTGMPALCRDTALDPRFAPWRADALERGYRSCLMLPLKEAERSIGVLAIYSRAVDDFPEGEVSLLQELAGDLGYGIAMARLRAEKTRADADLREASRHKDEFLAILAHELRNPLAPIRTAAHILSLRRTEDPDLQRLYEVIGRQSGQMARLVDDLLDVSRLERGKIELRRQRVDFSSVVGHAVEVCAHLIEQRGHRVELELPGQALEVDGDPVRLEQIVCNLVTNACKHTPDGGNIRILAVREDGAVVLRVRDNGIGMSQEVLAHIFDMFYQGGTTPGQREGGLGLGLTLVSRLTQLHGGSITAASAGLAQGSEFTLSLPALEQAPEPIPALAPHPSAGAGAECRPRHVLVIDDNPGVVTTLRLLLGAAGYQVSEAVSGTAGVRQAMALRPDLALVDIGLPDLSGLEVARRIRAGLGGGIHLIALTGFSRESDILAAREAGFDQHLVKTADPRELIKAVDGHFDRQ